MMKRTAAAFAALAASCTPALAHVAPWSSPDPPPLAVQFLVGIALMAVAGAVVLWQGGALAREALAGEGKRRRASQDPRAYKKAGGGRSAPLWLSSSMRSAGGRRVSAPTADSRRAAKRVVSVRRWLAGGEVPGDRWVGGLISRPACASRVGVGADALAYASQN